MAGAIAYEEQRRRQVEENKRKLEELNLRHLSAALRDAAPKPSPVKSVKRKPRGPPAGDAPPRRSGRVASLPEQPKYRYEDTYHVLETKIRKRVSRTHSTRSDLINRVYAAEDARAHAITMAQELHDRLDSTHPSFVKPMTQSHVTGGFWLGLPKQFCTKHLPKRDEWITLVDEEDVESESYYLALKWGLSARWKAFAIDHKLVDGDCLVFELIEWAKFKVYLKELDNKLKMEIVNRLQPFG